MVKCLTHEVVLLSIIFLGVSSSLWVASQLELERWRSVRTAQLPPGSIARKAISVQHEQPAALRSQETSVGLTAPASIGVASKDVSICCCCAKIYSLDLTL